MSRMSVAETGDCHEQPIFIYKWKDEGRGLDLIDVNFFMSIQSS
jgi:hypothetical protein